MTSAEHREHALLEHLAETDAIDTLLDLVSLTDIADALLTYYRSQEQMHDGTRDRATAAVTQWAQAVSATRGSEPGPRRRARTLRAARRRPTAPTADRPLTSRGGAGRSVVYFDDVADETITISSA